MKVGAGLVKLYAFYKNREKKKYDADMHGYVLCMYKDIPYISDGDDKHKYDVLITNKERKNICVIDIHGGSYLFGNRRYNYEFGKAFLNQGYDFISIDYKPNSSGRDTSNIILDCVLCLNHIVSNLDKYGLEYDKIVITGDSAGGHLALIISEMLNDNSIAESLGYDVPKIKPICTLLSCPVYDYEKLGLEQMSDGARKVMFGNNIDNDNMKKISPKTYIDTFNLPLFVSTCKNDFLRREAYILNDDMKDKDVKFMLYDLDSNNRRVGHVHNVIYPNLKESIDVNNKMLEFLYEAQNG